MTPHLIRRPVMDSTTPAYAGGAPTVAASHHVMVALFDTAGLNVLYEDLFSSPLHAIPDHRPLGVTHRLRKVMYDRISGVRHEMSWWPAPGIRAATRVFEQRGHAGLGLHDSDQCGLPPHAGDCCP